MVNGLTAAERYTIDFSCDLLIGQLERVHSLLYDMWEEYFATARPHPLTEYEVEKIGDSLYVYTDIIFDILREYALMMGNMDFRGVEPYLRTAHKAELAAECEALIGKVQNLADCSDKDRATTIRTQLNEAMKLPDKEAIQALKIILEGEKGGAGQ